MVARTTAEDGLKVLLIERKRDITSTHGPMFVSSTGSL